MLRSMPMILIPVLAVMAGCSGELTPEQICSKVAELEAKAGEAKNKSKAQLKKDRAECIMDMRRLKKKSPKAYRCAAKCTKQENYDLAMACTVACAFKHTSKKESEKIKAEARKNIDALCKSDWSGKALHPVTATVLGVKISLKVPKGMKRQEGKPKAKGPEYVAWTVDTNICAPSISIRKAVMEPASLDQVIAAGDDEMLLKKAVPGGFLAVTGEKNRQSLEVEVYKKAKSGVVLRFSISQRSDKLPKVFKAQQAWMLKVGESFQVE